VLKWAQLVCERVCNCVLVMFMFVCCACMRAFICLYVRVRVCRYVPHTFVTLQDQEPQLWS
jgi:hypothetical protein